MKHILYGFAIITLLQFVSCGGGSGAGGSEPLPGDTDTTTQTVNDTTTTTDTTTVTPTVDPDAYITDTTTTDTTSTTTTDTTVADNSDKDKDKDKDNGTGKSGQDTDIPGNNDSGTGPDNKDTGATVTDNTTTGTTGNTTTAGDTTATDSTVVADEDISADEDDVDADTIDENGLFNFATSVTLPATLTFRDKDSGAAIAGIEITVYNPEDESVLARAFSDANGVAEFDISGINPGSRIELVFKKEGYTPISGYYIEKNDIAAISGLIRTLELTRTSGKTTVSDQDKDGVADQNDEFPADKSIAKVEKHSYILAFEDRYPGLGDLDFNDAVIKYDIDEYISAENTVPKIIIRTQVLAAGTNKEGVFAVNVAGKEYTLVSNVKKELKSWNTRLSDRYQPGKVNETTIEFNKPLGRKTVGSAPFDPFLIPNGAHVKKHHGNNFRNEIHLSWVKTSYKRMRFSRNGMTWALLLPSGWIWPTEKTGGIFRAYPKFATWYRSAGKTSADWYTGYDSDYVFTQAGSASSIAGYLFDNKLLGTTVLLMLIAAAGSAIAVMRYFRLRRD